MLLLLYLTTGFVSATVVASAAFLIALVWQGVQASQNQGRSVNFSGGRLGEIVIAWIALGCSSAALILLLLQYP